MRQGRRNGDTNDPTAGHPRRRIRRSRLAGLAPSPLPTAVPYGQQAGFSDGNVLPVLANPDRGLSAIRNSGPQQEPKATGNGSKALYAAAAWDNALRLARLAVAPPRDGAAPDAGFDAFSARAPPAEV